MCHADYLLPFSDWELTDYGKTPAGDDTRFVLPLVMQYLTPEVRFTDSVASKPISGNITPTGRTLRELHGLMPCSIPSMPGYFTIARSSYAATFASGREGDGLLLSGT